jgi:hypothetical protein
MKEIAEYKKYHVITIPDLHAVNCIYLNNTLLHCSHEEYPNSAKVFASKIDYPRIEVKNREFNKVDRYLTCRCLLFTKKKIYSILSSSFFSNLRIGKLIIQMKGDIEEGVHNRENKKALENNTNRIDIFKTCELKNDQDNDI